MMMRSILLAGLLLASQAHALTAADITLDTACGAPGVGWEGIRSQGTERVVAKQQPGLRVSGSGWWTACRMPPACQEKRTHTWDSGDGRGRCSPGIGTIRAGKLGDKRTVIDARWRGRLTYQCTADGWQIVDGYCR